MAVNTELARRMRPATLDEVWGNTEVVETLQAFLKKDNRPQTYLFKGASGCGKTTLARAYAHELGVDDLDLLEINASDNNGIDDMRQLIEALSYHGFGDSRAVILDESHLLSNSAQNSILKLLEEPPKDTYIFLCTTDPQKLLRTILSRCIQLEVHPLNDRVMLKKLKGVVESEKLNLSTDVLEVIVEKAEGVPRVALKLMDKVDGMDEATALTTLAKESSVSDIIDPDVGNLCRAFLKKESWKEISAILRTLKGQDPEAVRRQVLGYMAAVLLNRGDAAPAIVMSYFVDSFFTSGYGGLVYACFGATQELRS